MALLATSLDAQNVTTVIPSGLREPNGVATDYSNNYYIADGGSGNQIMVNTADGVSAFAGSGLAGAADGVGADASFNEPWGIVYVPSRGSLVVSDHQNQLIRLVNLSTHAVTTIAGQLDPFNGGGMADGAGSAAQFSFPAGLAADSAGNVYIADMGNGAIRKLAPNNSVSTVVSNLSLPSAVALSDNNTMWVADATKNQILRFTFAGGVWSASDVVGDPQGGYFDSVTEAKAKFNQPRGLAWVGGATGLAVADTGNNALRRISGNPGAYVVSTITNGIFNTPLGLAVDSESSILIADSKNGSLKAYVRPGQPMPTVSPVGGNYSNAVTITFSTSFSGQQVFRYTTDGTTPLTYSQQGTSVTIDGNPTVLQVRSFSPDYATSPVSSNLYTFTVDTPVISPVAQSASNLVTITVSEATVGASLYYTLDGSEPTQSSTAIVGNSFTLARTNSGVKVKGFKAGYTSSATAIGAFDFFVAAPEMSVAGGTYSNDVVVTLSTPTEGAAIYWTTNGTEPALTNGSTSTTLTIVQSCTFKAKAFRNGFVDSVTVSAPFVMVTDNPVITPSGATNDNVVLITATEATAGAALRWTIDGSIPTMSSGTALSGIPFAVGTNGLLTVKSFRPGYSDSQPVTVVVALTVAAPVMSTAGLTTNNPVPITLNSDTVGAKIYWTIDGSEPTNSGPNFVNNGGTVVLNTNGFFKAKAFLPGFVPSQTVGDTFNLRVDAPQILASTTSSNNIIRVTLTNATANSIIYWTIDGSTPDSNSPNSLTNGSSFFLGTNGTLQAMAVLPGSGLLPSAISSKAFSLKVSDPGITPAGATNNNMVLVTFTNLSVGTYYYTLDGTVPGPANGFAYSGPFWLSNSGPVAVIGQTNGFVNSAIVSANFSLSVAPISVTPINSTAINSTVVTITNATTNALIQITVTAADGSSTKKLAYTNTPGTPINVTITNNASLTIAGSFAGFIPVQAGPLPYLIQVDQPQMSPSGGYFPSGTQVTLSVVRPDARIYYTLNGNAPTTNDTLYTGPIDLDSIHFPKTDLRIVRAAAFAPDTLPSAVCSGQSLPSNSVSVATSVIGGAGSTLVLPVVINLQSNQTLRSLQFKLEVSPLSGGATPNTNWPIEALSLSANDYVQVAGNSDSGYNASFQTGTYAVGPTNGIIFFSLATNLLINDFGVLANVKVRIPGTAPVGSTYLVNVTNISGTSDAGQLGIALTSSPGMITVSNYVYLAGDCSPGRWYNAGDFGNDALDNADVNAAFEASIGIHQPYPGSDAFNSMDVYPETTTLAGDGLITYLDWQHILLRSLGRETNSWKRWWENGTLHHSRINGPGLTRSLRASTAVVPQAAMAPSAVDIWLRHALIWGEIITNATPGNAYSMAIYAKVLPGFEINGMQLRAIMVAEGGAPTPGTVQFVAADSMGQPSTVLQSSPNDVAFAWSLGRPVDPLVRSNLIGYVKFTVPQAATAGQHYTIKLAYPQGATDLDTERQLESAAGQVWVLSSPAKPVRHIVSDQWKTNFFGTLTNPNADADADPDHDGVPNWMEYLSGTNPTNADSHLSFSATDKPAGGQGVTLHWPAVTGRVYVLESSATLSGATWTPVSTNIIGDGTLRAFTTSDGFDKSRFYRIRLIEQ